MSAQTPPESVTKTQQRRITPPDVRARKGAEPLVCLTAYDAPTARLLDPHCDVLLVGDSVGMVVHGLPNTIPVTLEMMVLHGQAVMRGSARSLVVVDMPFGSYETSREQAFDNAARILRETGAQAVKLESGVYIAETIRFLAERGVPVMAHVGLRPQAALAEGGFKAKGRDEAERARVLAEARAADEAGAFAIVVEGVAEELAGEITQAVKAPTIGIGASASCDGQILVTPDMLGLFDWTPRFVKRYADLKGLTEEAVKAYAEEVRARRFPGPDEVYRIKSR
ncbi:MAG: 3-methyl-2-oxobutanoate hydroxymethyltransferase [Oceanicaulis sp.]|uniref:3-methyl-2-oxobutanoate hydroxymethyltransferase n=1 Tax=Glycocaulis sp. TaxID=1969725 RepID=UPI0025BB3C18|nr:3-methyl-2-oxobutanoate hydroxymethyltransferase [Glycocaulis sp.]MCC5980658.1 3-methyl-2-oxobutanoate hydroxymethyltransferase [Oceanicaulis sp.]MCH8521885.1 3-methyl-2-oxobutanoate hydroxymethyltransferase [Glycocaulis sp.]